MEFIVDHKTLGDLPYAINLKGKELTRCRYCRWFEPEYEYYENHGNGAIETLCEPPSCNRAKRSLDGDCGYCAWGDRRES